MSFRHLFFSVFFLATFSASLLHALENPEQALPDAGVSPVLGGSIDLGLVFTESDGQSLPLSKLFSVKRPLILVPAYYDCPRLCGLVLGGVTKLLNQLPLKLGEDFQVATVSFDSSETPELASERKEKYLAQLTDQDKARQGWHFFVGKEENIAALMNQIGFKYLKDGTEFAHSSALILLTPEGKISQYFTGIDFPANDVRLALVEASLGTIGSALDHVLLFCFRFDPTKGKYTFYVVNIVRAGGVLTLIFIVWLIYTLRRRERSVIREGV